MARKLTISQAFGAAMAPYALPSNTIELLLQQQGLDSDGEYSADVETQLYLAVIEGLYTVKSLIKEEDAGSANTYDAEELDKRIERYRRKYDPEAGEDYDFINRTEEW